MLRKSIRLYFTHYNTKNELTTEVSLTYKEDVESTRFHRKSSTSNWKFQIQLFYVIRNEKATDYYSITTIKEGSKPSCILEKKKQ